MTACACGKGDIVYFADGTPTCTCTINKYEALYGELKYSFAPIHKVDPRPPRSHITGVDCLPSVKG